MSNFLEESSLTIRAKKRITKVYADEFTCDQQVAVMRSLKDCVSFSLGEKYINIAPVLPIEERVHGKRELVNILSCAFVAANLDPAELHKSHIGIPVNSGYLSKLDEFLSKVKLAASR